MSNPGPASTSTTVFVGGGNPVRVGNNATDLVGFYNATAIVQRSGSAQAAVTVTITSTSTIAFTTSAGANALIAQVQEIAATLTALGLWKGAA